ncbi:MFS transporter [Spirochaeta isovalerica]|uniref:MFS family permease n=1 Tax=Spirochaeta isovalerica TaxID=150 RepID=A0A841RDJ0_9SPIO|nr:MFS transporter [Spirochaeta isovalerica]MBB6480919.1 MFS family permease [Spirochaeta isovalerica]
MTMKKLRLLASWNMSFHWFTLGIIIPVMTLFLLEKGLSLAQVGITFASYGAATVLLELPTGGLADALGRKKVYIYSLLFQITGALLVLFVNSLPALMICFIFQGVARSLSSGTMDAHFIDEFYRIDPVVNLQKEMARIGTFIPLGLGIGSLLGGFIPMALGKWTSQGIFNSVYASNYIIFIIALIVQLITTSLLVHEKQPDGEEAGLAAGFRKIPEVVGTSVKYGLGHPVLLLLLLATFAWGFSISGLEQLWQPRVQAIAGDGTGSWIYGLLTTGYFLAASVGSLVSIPFCRLFGDRYHLALFTARTLMGSLYFILAYQSGLIPFAFFYFTLFLFNGVQSSPESSIFNESVPSEKRSTLLSFSSLFMQTGGIAGSVALAFLAETYYIGRAWIVASIVIILSAALYLLIPYYQKKHAGGLNSEF